MTKQEKAHDMLCAALHEMQHVSYSLQAGNIDEDIAVNDMTSTHKEMQEALKHWLWAVTGN